MAYSTNKEPTISDVFQAMTNQDKKEYDMFLLNVYGSLIGGCL